MTAVTKHIPSHTSPRLVKQLEHKLTELQKCTKKHLLRFSPKFWKSSKVFCTQLSHVSKRVKVLHNAHLQFLQRTADNAVTDAWSRSQGVGSRLGMYLPTHDLNSPDKHRYQVIQTSKYLLNTQYT